MTQTTPPVPPGSDPSSEAQRVGRGERATRAADAYSGWRQSREFTEIRARQNIVLLLGGLSTATSVILWLYMFAKGQEADVNSPVIRSEYRGLDRSFGHRSNSDHSRPCLVLAARGREARLS